MNGISPIGRLPGATTAEPAAARGGSAFAGALRQAVEHVNRLHAESGLEIQRMLASETDDLHKTLLAVQKSELAFSLLLEVRNKVVQAYQEVMRIQV